MEAVVSDAVLTTTVGGSIIPDTLVPGNAMTQIGDYFQRSSNTGCESKHRVLTETIVEDASGYYISYSTTENIDDSSMTSSYIQVDYQTCSFSGVTGGCSDSDYLVELPTSGSSVVTSFHSDSFSGTLVGTTMTLPFQAVATSSVSGSANSTASASSSNGVLSTVKFAGVGLEVYLVLTSLVTLVPWVV